MIRPISPYVYGINSQQDEGIGVDGAPHGRQPPDRLQLGDQRLQRRQRLQPPERRLAVHARSATRDCSAPGAQFIDFAKENRKARASRSLATVPIVDYVTADKNGTGRRERQGAQQALGQVARRRSRARFSRYARPRRRDVYQDEFVNLLVNKLGKAVGGRHQVLLARQRAGAVAAARTRASTRSSTTLRRDGEAHRGDRDRGRQARSVGAWRWARSPFGWSRVHVAARRARRQGAQRQVRHLPRLLPGVDEGAGGQKHQKRLVHVLDVHWYPEARGAKRITDKDISPKTVAARAAGAAQPVGSDATSRRAGSPPSLGQADPPHPAGCRSRSPRATRAPSWR